MAVPFRRTSTTTKKQRRAPKIWAFQKKYSTQPLVKCSGCQTEKMLHQICSHCLTYKKLDFNKISKQTEKREE